MPATATIPPFFHAGSGTWTYLVADPASGEALVIEKASEKATDVYAVGECACAAGRCWGLVAPGYTQAEVVVDRLLGGARTFTGADMSTKLKLLGIDVASFGDCQATEPGALELVYADPIAGVYSKLVVSDDASRLLGGVLVGDASPYPAPRRRAAAAAGRCLQALPRRLPVSLSRSRLPTAGSSFMPHAASGRP